MGSIIYSDDDELLQVANESDAKTLVSNDLFAGQKVYIKTLGMYYFSPAVLPKRTGEIELNDLGGKLVKYESQFLYIDDDNQISHLNIGETSKQFDVSYRYDGDKSGSDQLNDVVIGRVPTTSSSISLDGDGLGIDIILEENFPANASQYTTIFVYKRSADGSGKTLVGATSNRSTSFNAFVAVQLSVSLSTLNGGDVLSLTTSKVGGDQFLPPMSIFLNGIPTS